MPLELPLDLPGTDAYYLIEQAQSVFAHGHLKIHDGNIIPFIMAGMMHLGLTAPAAFYLFFALLFGAFAGFLAFVCSRVPHAWIIGILSAPLFTYHAYEFPKMSLAALLYLLMLQFAFRCRIVPTLFLGIACATIHPFFIGLVALTFLILYIYRFNSFSMATRKRMLIGIIAGLVTATLILQNSGIWLLLTRTNLSSYLITNIGLILILAIALFCIDLYKGRAWPLFALPFFALMFWPSNPSEMFATGERISFLLSVLAGPAILIGLSARCEYPRPSSKMRAGAFVLAAIAMLTAHHLVQRELPQTDYRPIARITDRLSKRPISMLIAPRQFKFFYTARTTRDAFFFEPETSWAKSDVWRLTQNISRDEYSYFLSPECQWTSELVERLDVANATLIREDCWAQFRAAIPADDLPDLYRRAWDHEQNPSRPRAFASSFVRRLLNY